MNKQFVDDSQNKIKAILLTLNHLTAQTIEITQNTSKIGKGEECDFQINDSNVSATHFQIKFQNGEIILTDLSIHGTYLNDSKIGKGNKVVIKNNDQIYLMPYSQCRDKDQAIGFLFKTADCGKNQQKKQQNGGKKFEVNFSKKGQQEQEYDWLEDDVQCTICRECMFEAVTVNPCHHHFCGACLSNWIDQENKKCPNCREKILGIMKAHTMNNIIEKYLHHHPDKVKSQEVIEQIKKENLIYQNPDKYIKFKQQGLARQFEELLLDDSPNISDDDDSEEDSSESPINDDDFDEAQVPQQVNQILHNPQNAQEIQEIINLQNVVRITEMIGIFSFIRDVMMLRRMQ